ncbi:MAG: alpha/beta hydrolase, partial [Synechococcales bacterium]|nr:alpha/beta hydrolase [Synechococcales bacterium]
MSNSDWTHEFLATNGITLHCVTQGQGDLMVMLHGFPECWYSWRHQIPEFAQQYRVIAPDLRGYNESDKPKGVEAYRMSELVKDVEGLVHRAGYDRCILVGHDWGGAIAWNVAITCPDLVERLIVMNIPHPAKFAAGLQTPQQLMRSWYVFFFQIPWLPEWLISLNDYEAIASAFLDMAVDKSAFSPADIDVYKDVAAKRGGLTAMLNYYRSLLQHPSQAIDRQWPVIHSPTLMIWGENDAALGIELTYGTDQYVSNLDICYIPHCSHWVQQEQPHQVN